MGLAVKSDVSCTSNSTQAQLSQITGSNLTCDSEPIQPLSFSGAGEKLGAWDSGLGTRDLDSDLGLELKDLPTRLMKARIKI